MKNNLLTVNVITYNHKPYIAKCLDSLLEQKTDFGFIIRVFDDCSTDGTTEICREYAEKYPNKIFFYPTEKNLGPTLNPLRSYKNIETPYYLYIEGDDYRIDKKGLKKQIHALEKNPGCAFCAAETINLYEGVFKDSHPNLKEGIYSNSYVYEHCQQYVYPNLGTRVVRTSCINLTQHPENYLWDLSQFFELLDTGDMYFIDEEYMVYRMTGSGESTGKNACAMLAYIVNLAGKYCNKNDRSILNFLYILNVELLGAVERENKKRGKTEVVQNMNFKAVNNLKKVRRYFIPPFLRDVAHVLFKPFHHIRRFK